MFSTCIAMPASRPPVAMTRTPATMPKASRSTKTGASWAPCARANSTAGQQDGGRPRHPWPERREQPAEGLGQVAAEGVLLPRRLQRGEQHDDEHEVAERVAPVVQPAGRVGRVSGRRHEASRRPASRSARRSASPNVTAIQRQRSRPATEETQPGRHAVEDPGEEQRDRDRGGQREVEVGQQAAASRGWCRSARSSRSPTSSAPVATKSTTKPTSSANCATSISSTPTTSPRIGRQAAHRPTNRWTRW